MSFTTPLALLGLLILPLIILFYMWRARHQRQVVSSIWLWEEALARFSHRPSRRLPLREPLLLLQLLAALVLTVLLAGPRLDRPAALHRIVILDGSVAMAATDVAPTRFAHATKRVTALIAGLGSGDTLSLILAGPRARFLGQTPGPLDLATAVRALGQPAGPADLAGAAALARGLAGQPGLGAPRLTFLAAAQTPPLPVGNLPVQTERFGGPLDDQGIGALSVRCLAGGACQAFARIRNLNPAARDDDLAVWADDQLLGRQTLHLPALGSLDLAFAVPSGAHLLRASLLRHDALAADDTAWALTPAPLPLRVLLISDSPGVLLHVLRAIPGVNVQVLGTAAYQDSSFAGQDLVVFDGDLPDNPPPVPLLLVHPPDNNVLMTVRADNVFLPVSRIDTTDPLLAGLDLFGMTATGQSLVTPSWARELVGGARGPLILYGTQSGQYGEPSGQRIAVLAFEPSQSGFADDVAFPVLMARLIRWLAPPPPPSVAPGAAVWLPENVQAVRDPAGDIRSGPLVTADAAGVYAIASGTGSAAAGTPLFAVTTADPGDTTGAAAVSPWSAPASRGTFPFALWPLVLVLALAALCGEWWFYARRT